MARARLVVLLIILLVSSGCASPVVQEPSPSEQASGPTAAGQSSTPVPSTAPVRTATVVDVVDGDTVKIRYENGTRETVRLLGVDTPEVYSENTPTEFEGVPDTAAGRQCLRRAGERASQFTADRLEGTTVGLGFDENEGRRGYYGRLLAYVYVDGEQFNYRLVADGYARMYDSEFVERTRYAAAERRAQAAGSGLWSCATASGDGGTTAVDGTSAESDDSALAVSVHADAAGPDGDNLTDEYVTLTNTGDSTLDVSGWTIADAAGHVYTFPEGATIALGASVTVYTGSGTDTDTERYWGRDTPVWNNDGDTVTVRDDEGTTVAVHRYS